MTKPCPFCCNPNAEDTGGACCFCDYEGVVSIGEYGTFANIKQYNAVYYTSSHEDRIKTLSTSIEIDDDIEVI